MSRRITAQQAHRIYVASQPDIFEQKAHDKQRQINVLVKLVKSRKGYDLAKAVKIAKRAYRMGVRVD